MINLFCGYDVREDIGYRVFVNSVQEHSSESITWRRLDACGLPEGSNAFTFSRFLVPWMQGFKGHAIFADASDMLVLQDVAELESLFDPRYALQCVQHAYRTRNPTKYIGTDMQCHNRDYQRKNWASLMIVNCEHLSWAHVTPEWVEAMSEAPSTLLGLKWIRDADIGHLPPEWNVLADEGQELEGACLLHWTAGIPAFKHYKNAPGAALWHKQRKRVE